MTDFKLISLLKTFSKAEFKDFEKFVSSPYFSRGRDLLPLLKALKPYYPEFSSKDFTVEKIYENIFPGKRYGDAKSDSLMKTLISELYKMCIDFLAYSSFKEDEKRKSFYVLDQIRRRKHYIEFEKEYEKIINQNNNINKGGFADFIEKYFLYSVFKNYSLDRDDFVNSFEYTLATDENIVAAALMMTFMIEDVKNTSNAYNIPMRYNLMNNLLENLNSENLLEEMKKNDDRFYPYVLIFFLIYKMNKFKDKREYYYELKRLLIENQHLFGQSENYVLWNIMQTYCSANKLNEEHIYLYDYILKNNIYKKSESEDFHIILFRNIVLELAVLSRYEELEKFIERYYGELHKEHRESMYHYSYAHLHFGKGNYENALEYTSKINYDVFVFKIDARLLLFKIFFELSYFEQAYSLVDSTTHFLRSTNEFSELQKSFYLDIIKNFNELLKFKTSKQPDRDALSFFEKKVKEARHNSQIPWMLRKIEEMKK